MHCHQLLVLPFLKSSFVITTIVDFLPGSDLPRLLDMGQCNDAYSALVVATVSASMESHLYTHV